MLREMLKIKIQRVRVTSTDLDYEGSIAIDEALLDASGLLPFEKVHVLNINTGARAETYVIKGKRNSGEIVLNGAIARLVQVGDPLILIAYCLVDEKEAPNVKPVIVIVDEDNRVVTVR